MTSDKQDITSVIAAWQVYLQTITNWQTLIQGITPKESGCGLVYEIPNPIDRPDESFAIADMRTLPFAEPHYHHGIEIYFVLQGTGVVVFGDKEQEVSLGSVVIIPSETAHFTIPKEELIIAAVNTPPFTPEDYLPLIDSDEKVSFNKERFDTLVRNHTT